MTEPQVLGGRYQLGEVLGYGGMAEVRRGRDVRLDRDVAIKTLKPGLARDASLHTRFRREAQAAASLNHPAIVAVYDTGDESLGDTEVPYIVMEYVDGRTLRDVLHDEGRLLPQRALEITAEVLRALQYSHEHGIVHRDIKPGNVMLTRSGDVKVMDFGIARAVTASSATMTQTAAVIGTAQYLSPEQARGEHVDARSDIYSTGCLLYELLTGVPPFTGDSPVAVAYQHVRENPHPPSQVDPDIPPALDAIVLKALAKNPANRYQTAEEMRADIDRALAGRPVLATPVLAEDSVLAPPPPSTVLVRRPQPRPGRRGLAYLLLFLAAIAVFVVAVILARSLVGTKSGDLNTPRLKGLSLPAAESLLARDGLKVGTVTQQFSTVPKDYVIDQSPEDGILVSRGDSINLVVSAGIQYVGVPNLTNMKLSDAKSALAAAHLKLGAVTQTNSTQPAGTVLQQTPGGGQRVPAGSSVALVVANGDVQVPKVTGLDQQAATQLLQQAGFTVVTTRINDPTHPVGLVERQSPADGTWQPKGSTVLITVNAAPSPSPTPAPTKPGKSKSPSPTASPTH